MTKPCVENIAAEKADLVKQIGYLQAQLDHLLNYSAARRKAGDCGQNSKVTMN